MTIPSEASTRATTRLTATLLISLALLSAAGPFAIDLYLPAFPQMEIELLTSASGVQLSLTAFLIGAGLGQLCFGPLSDRIGRIRPLLWGAALYVVAGVAAAFAQSLILLVVFRLIQGISGAAGMVVSRAMIADIAKGKEAARAFSLMMLIGGVAPVIAPIVGSLLVERVGWRGLLGVVAGVGVLALVFAVAFLRETHPHEARTKTVFSAEAFRAIAKRSFIGNALAFAFAFATMMAFISASPFIYQKMMGMSEVQFALMFSLNAISISIVGAVSARLARRIAAPILARAGLAINFAGTAIVFVLVLVGVPTAWLVAPILLAVSSLGLIFGTMTAIALGQVPGNSGLGSAVLGLSQFALAGFAAPLVGIGGGTTMLPLAIVMFTASIAANVLFRYAASSNEKQPQSPQWQTQEMPQPALVQ